MSADGDEWETVHQAPVVLEVNPRSGTQRIAAEVHAGPVRYLRVRARNLGQCPEWLPGAGGVAWLFVDEIVVEGGDID